MVVDLPVVTFVMCCLCVVLLLKHLKVSVLHMSTGKRQEVLVCLIKKLSSQPTRAIKKRTLEKTSDYTTACSFSFSSKRNYKTHAFGIKMYTSVLFIVWFLPHFY